MQRPTVTVLTAVKDGAAYLAETIASVQSQTFGDWEYVIVDDASSDGTVGIVERHAADDPRIRLVRREDSGGPFVAANTGLAEARGEFVARIDADDIALPQRLERQVAHIESDPDLRACASWWTILDDAPSTPSMFPTTSPRVFCWAVCVVSGLAHSTAMVARRSFEDMGGYAELPVAADYGLWCWLSRRRSVGLIPEPLVSWRRHVEQISASKLEQQVRASGPILVEHLHELTGEDWTLEEAEALWRTGRWFPVDLRTGFAALDRWELHWRRDAHLRPPDRRELTRLTHRVRARLVKWNHHWDAASLAAGAIGWARIRLKARRAP